MLQAQFHLANRVHPQVSLLLTDLLAIIALFVRPVPLSHQVMGLRVVPVLHQIGILLVVQVHLKAQILREVQVLHRAEVILLTPVLLLLAVQAKSSVLHLA